MQFWRSLRKQEGLNRHRYLFPICNDLQISGGGIAIIGQACARSLQMRPGNKTTGFMTLGVTQAAPRRAKRAVNSMSWGVARSGQISPRTVKAMERWGKQRWQTIKRGFFTTTVPNTVRIFRLV
jgi:hypothetical protein